MALKYYKNLDGIRGIAVLLVMFGHFFMNLHSQFEIIETILRKISILGQLGVALFFVLSGFLITRILLYTKEKSGYFKNFYVRRVLRIFPLYYFFLLLYYFVFPFIFNTEIPPLSQQIYYYTYLQNFALTFNWNAEGPVHFWSLAIEEHFYLFWPLLIYIFKNNHVIKIILGIIITSILLRYIFLSKSIDVYYFTFTRIDALAIGAVLALFEQGALKFTASKRFYMLLITLSFIPTFILWVFFGGEAIYVLQILKYVLFSFGFFAVIGFVTKLKPTHFITKFLRNKPLVYTGKISYGLYVYHVFSINLISQFIHSDYWFIMFVLSFLTAYLIAGISFRYFESYFLSMKKYFSSRNQDEK